MSTLVKAGAKSEAKKATVKREVTPKLVCIITGASRFTNKDYLAGKAASAGSVVRFIKHYICTDAMKLLREAAGEKPYAGITGTTVETIREKLKVKPETIKEANIGTPSIDTLKVALDINGKRAKKVKVAKPAKPEGAAKAPAKPRAPKAPKVPKSETPGSPASTAAVTTTSGSEPTTPAGQ